MTEGDKDKDGVLNKEEFYEVIKSGCDISDKLTIRFWDFCFHFDSLEIGCDNPELVSKSTQYI